MDELLEIEQIQNSAEFYNKHPIKSEIIEIVVKDKVIQAHKEVLASRNSVFLDEILSQPDLYKIKIPDLDPEAVENFINYLHSGEIPVENVSDELFLVAYKYVDLNLKNICRKVLGQSLTLKNATSRLLTFLNCKEKQLVKETSTFLAKNFNNVKIYSDFKEVFANNEAASALFDAFACCKITILSEDRNPNRKSLIESAKKSDLTITVQNHSFLVHKNILSTRNTVFKTDISALSTTDEFASSIEVTDFDSSTFKAFLKYIYTHDVNKDEFTKSLINVALKYADPSLFKICEVHLVSKVEESNAIKMLLLSLEVGSSMLKKEASKIIAEKYEEMKSRIEFWKLTSNPQAVEAICSQFAERVRTLTERCNQQNSDFYIYQVTFKMPRTEGATMNSITFFMKGTPWRITASQRSSHVGLFLHCLDQAVPCVIRKVTCSLTLISHVDKSQDLSETFVERSYSATVKSWGWQRFVSVADLCDLKKGFVVNNKITVQYEVRFVK